MSLSTEFFAPVTATSPDRRDPPTTFSTSTGRIVRAREACRIRGAARSTEPTINAPGHEAVRWHRGVTDEEAPWSI